jgi:hypothetical protein
VRIAATFLVIVAAGIVRVKFGHECSYSFLALAIAVPRIFTI